MSADQAVKPLTKAEKRKFAAWLRRLVQMDLAASPKDEAIILRVADWLVQDADAIRARGDA